MKIEFTVYGKAEPGGSKSAFVPRHPKTKRPFEKDGRIMVNVVDSNPNVGEWKKTVAKAAKKAYRGKLLSGALAVSFRFFRVRPEGHYGTSSLNLKGRTTPYPTTKPDVLKLARAVEDALTDVVWNDDALIVGEYLSKEWGEARVEISIEELNPKAEQPALLATEPEEPELPVAKPKRSRPDLPF